jgi:hypothetical protein
LGTRSAARVIVWVNASRSSAEAAMCPLDAILAMLDLFTSRPSINSRAGRRSLNVHPARAHRRRSAGSANTVEQRASP